MTATHVLAAHRPRRTGGHRAASGPVGRRGAACLPTAWRSPRAGRSPWAWLRVPAGTWSRTAWTRPGVVGVCPARRLTSYSAPSPATAIQAQAGPNRHGEPGLGKQRVDLGDGTADRGRGNRSGSGRGADGRRRWGPQGRQRDRPRGRACLGSGGKIDRGVVTVTTRWADVRVCRPLHACPCTLAHHRASVPICTPSPCRS